jgi:CheY-like chemotaxis protein
MAKNALPMFFRDPTTGVMKQLTPNHLGDFPLAQGEKRPAPARVLVADDDKADRFLTIWQLAKAWPVEGEMLVECAADGEEALEKIRSKQYALVVLDWSLPQLIGAEMLRAIREGDRRVPVVVVSDQCRGTIWHELQSMSAAYLHKEELDAHSFRNAIAASMKLQEGRGADHPGLDVRSG